MSKLLKTKSGTLLTTQEEQLKRWEEHFSGIFNKEANRAGSKEEMRKIKDNKSENETEINLDPPTKTEMQQALTQLKNANAVGITYLLTPWSRVHLEKLTSKLCS